MKLLKGINLYYLSILLLIVMLLSVIMIFNRLVDSQNVFLNQNDVLYKKYANAVLESENGVYSNIPVNDTLLRYKMLEVMQPECVLYGSSHITTASFELMPSIFKKCKSSLNVWVTGGGPISGLMMARSAVKNNVKMFVYEIHPWWYNFANFEFWKSKKIEYLNALKWINLGENQVGGKLVTKIGQKQGENQNQKMSYISVLFNAVIPKEISNLFTKLEILANFKYTIQNFIS